MSFAQFLLEILTISSATFLQFSSTPSSQQLIKLSISWFHSSERRSEMTLPQPSSPSVSRGEKSPLGRSNISAASIAESILRNPQNALNGVSAHTSSDLAFLSRYNLSGSSCFIPLASSVSNPLTACSAFGCSWRAVSYTHLTLPTNREV